MFPDKATLRRLLPRLQTKLPRVIARKNGSQLGLYSRPANDFIHRFPLIERLECAA
jgi:hypothetical protein